jgi:hypothetical protein
MDQGEFLEHKRGVMKNIIPRHSHWYRSIICYPWYYRYFLTILVVCGLGCFWYFGLYRYVNKKIGFYTHINKALRAQILEREKKQSSLAILSQSTSNLQRELRSYKETQNTPNEFMFFLMQQLCGARMVLLNGSIEAPIIQTSYTQYPITLNLQGSFESLYGYLKDIMSKTKSLEPVLITLSQLKPHMYRIVIRFNYMLLR